MTDKPIVIPGALFAEAPRHCFGRAADTTDPVCEECPTFDDCAALVTVRDAAHHGPRSDYLPDGYEYKGKPVTPLNGGGEVEPPAAPETAATTTTDPEPETTSDSKDPEETKTDPQECEFCEKKVAKGRKPPHASCLKKEKDRIAKEGAEAKAETKTEPEKASEEEAPGDGGEAEESKDSQDLTTTDETAADTTGKLTLPAITDEEIELTDERRDEIGQTLGIICNQFERTLLGNYVELVYQAGPLLDEAKRGLDQTTFVAFGERCTGMKHTDIYGIIRLWRAFHDPEKCKEALLAMGSKSKLFEVSNCPEPLVWIQKEHFVKRVNGALSVFDMTVRDVRDARNYEKQALENANAPKLTGTVGKEPGGTSNSKPKPTRGAGASAGSDLGPEETGGDSGEVSGKASKDEKKRQAAEEEKAKGPTQEVLKRPKKLLTVGAILGIAKEANMAVEAWMPVKDHLPFIEKVGKRQAKTAADLAEKLEMMAADLRELSEKED